MFFNKEEQNNSGAQPAARRRALKLHSVPALLKERRFEGDFELRGAKHKLVYAPSRAEISGGKLRLRGKLAVTDARGRTRSLDDVSAVLASTQGGIGGGPPRRIIEGFNLPSESVQQPGGPLPITESAGPLSFCGVMYFHFEPLDARALGVAADLSRVQLNARLAPVDATARDLHGLYSLTVDTLYVDKPDERSAGVLINEINKALRKV
ncbi:MAG TPA: hypothetical protein VLD57_09355 [Blastocatellia bacterium]|nr:hypothetical protein [Blastocatellia bacterium]